MLGMLDEGLVLTAESGSRYEIIKKLGAGGQGEVYEAECLEDEKRHALKWYFRKSATPKQQSIIENLIRLGRPDDTFLWPEDIIYTDDGFAFGYIMPLRPRNFKSIVDLMKRRAEPSFASLCKAAYSLTKGYERLHEAGLAYGDISFGNLFFNPQNGDVLICDNDNASPVGGGMSVFGTPRFMAPEIVVGKARPSRNTDLFSLAVLLFYMLMLHHPLEGKAEYDIKALDIHAMNKLYGKNPVFIFDPDNSANRPVAGVHDNALIYWRIYPERIRELFTKSFTTGLSQPERRVTEKEWKSALANLMFGILTCSCGAEVFCGESDKAVCWNCKSQLQVPLTLVSGKSRVPLRKNTLIYSHHINGDYDIDTVAGTVVQNPANPGQWGLRNDSGQSWTYIKPDGSHIPVTEGKTAGISRGVRIDFGFYVGEII